MLLVDFSLDMSRLQIGTIIAQCTYAYRNPRWQTTDACGFHEKLEQTYKAIIQIACKNAE